VKKIVLLHELKRAWMPVHKVATQTLYHSIYAGCPMDTIVKAEEYLEKYADYELIAIHRNPYDRLISCYEFFHQNAYKFGEHLMPDPQYAGMLEEADIMKWEWFVRDVIRSNDLTCNAHFKSQKECLTFEGQFLPDRVIDIKDIDLLLDLFDIKEFRTRNATKKEDFDYYYGDQDIQNAVYKRFENDFIHFGYER